jgi:CRISPR-associated endonuclease/helicase Cas3
LTVQDFVRFYSAIHEEKLPFPWQERLVGRLLQGDGWPEAIAIPTASGKTSVLDAAVFSLAAQAGMRALERSAALRTFFVVDRRLVVDDVTEHARRIEAAVRAGTDPILVEVRNRLASFGADFPLAVATLRGGMYRNNAWANSPNQPLICVSTVDQAGSRLLFRGYGVAVGRRPVDAALLGNDSLILLDEAHLSNPFRETLRNVQRYQSGGFWETRVARGLRFVEMSATTREAGGDRFELDGADYANPVLRARLQATKLAELRESAQLENDAVEEAFRLSAGAGVVGVILNTVSLARAVFERIRVEAGEDAAVLLTGRIRPYDRDQLIRKYLNRMKAGRADDPEHRLFVVATQTVEVGADLDFDALVTESAPIDSLRQRFGRLNRLGRRASSAAVILKPKREKELPIYGEALEWTWEWLIGHATVTGKRKVVDFGALSMGELFKREGDERLLPAPKRAPILFQAHLDAWVQTNPAPAADPDVAPFLHGREALDAADVQVVWRRDLPESEDEQIWIETVSMLPPSQMEALPVTLWTFRKWIAGQLAPMTDLEAIGNAKADETAEASASFLIWRGPDESVLTRDSREVRPGDTLVVRHTVGGTDEFGWAPGRASSSAIDVGDECSALRAASGHGESAVRRSREEILGEANGKMDVEDEEQVEDLFRLGAGRDRRITGYGEQSDGRYLWFIGYGTRERVVKARREIADEEAEDDGMSLAQEITLVAHTGHVEVKSRTFLAGCGIAGDAERAVQLAARLHDLGKADARFQLMLTLSGAKGRELLGKGRRGSQRNELRWRQESGYPKGARHEFASLALAKQYAEWPNEEIRELALYLIATHHGYGRALAPAWDEKGNQLEIPAFQFATGRIMAEEAAAFARIASGWTDQFWRMTKKFGWWGAAYLEAILRRADCEASREEGEAR